MYRNMWRAGAVLTIAAGTLLVPTSAQALENVRSRYQVGCQVFDEGGSDSSTDAAPLTFDGDRSDASVRVADHTLSAGTTAIRTGAAAGTGENCWADASLADRLTVLPGTSGLAPGTVVPVTVSVTVDADLGVDWGTGPSATHVLADYGITASVVSRDDCAYDDEIEVCDTPLDYTRRHVHQVDAGGGPVDLTGTYSYDFATNAGDASTDYVDEDKTLCTGLPCPAEDDAVEDAPEQRETLTGTATLVVGDSYDIAAAIDSYTAAWQSEGASASVAVDELTVDIQPAAGAEGIDLAYASEGDGPAPDVTAPVVTATTDPAPVGGWHTGPTTVELTATDDTEVASITYAATGADALPETTDPGAATSVTIDADGTTTLTYWATDAAGNSSEPQELTLQIDTGTPMTRLRDFIEQVDVHHGLRNALLAKVRAAESGFAAGSTSDGCGALGALDNQVRAQTGKKITSQDAAVIRDLVEDVATSYGC